MGNQATRDRPVQSPAQGSSSLNAVNQVDMHFFVAPTWIVPLKTLVDCVETAFI